METETLIVNIINGHGPPEVDLQRHEGAIANLQESLGIISEKRHVHRNLQPKSSRLNLAVQHIKVIRGDWVILIHDQGFRTSVSTALFSSGWKKIRVHGARGNGFYKHYDEGVLRIVESLFYLSLYFNDNDSANTTTVEESTTILKLDLYEIVRGIIADPENAHNQLPAVTNEQVTETMGNMLSSPPGELFRLTHKRPFIDIHMGFNHFKGKPQIEILIPTKSVSSFAGMFPDELRRVLFGSGSKIFITDVSQFERYVRIALRLNSIMPFIDGKTVI